MKFCVQLFLVSALLLSSFYPQRAQELAADFSDYARPGLNRETSEQAGGTSVRPPNSEFQTDRPPSISKFVTVDGTRLHFAIRGGGRPVVLIHGNPGSAQDW